MKNLKMQALMFVISILIAACSAAPRGKTVETSPKKEVQVEAPKEGSILVDTEKSLVNWLGSKPAGEYTGNLKIKRGSLEVVDENLVGGSFVLDMTSINVTDLSGLMRSKLEGHLKKGDFFDVKKYPEGKFQIIKVTPIEATENATDVIDKNVTHLIGGNLTLLAETKFVELPAKIIIEGKKVIAETPQFTIDRTKWGIVYKSSKLGNAAIHDNIGIAIKLETK